MTKEDITQRLNEAKPDGKVCQQLTQYAVKSIEKGLSNYSVNSLTTYCNELGIKICIQDLCTEDIFMPTSASDIHKVIGLMMYRYQIDEKLIYRKTGVHYSAPKWTKRKEPVTEEAIMNSNPSAPLSINTLVEVCSCLHCNITFEHN